jgi:hypothetical protein
MLDVGGGKVRALLFSSTGSGYYEAPLEEGATLEPIEGLQDLSTTRAAVAGDALFWIDGDDKVWGAKISSPGPTMIAEKAFDEIHSDGQAVYWMGDQGSTFPSVHRAFPSTMRDQSIVSVAMNAWNLGFWVDESYVFTWNGAGTLFRTSKDGDGGAIAIAPVGESMHIVGTDACFVYGVDGDGSVVRARKVFPDEVMEEDGDGMGTTVDFDAVDFLEPTDPPGEPGTLRLDGFYYNAELEDNGSDDPGRDVMRFYADGVVIQSNTNMMPSDASFIDRDKTAFFNEGTYEIDGDRIEVVFPGDAGDSLYEGEIYEDQLNLRGFLEWADGATDERVFLFEPR